VQIFFLLQEHSKHPRGTVIAPKASSLKGSSPVSGSVLGLYKRCICLLGDSALVNTVLGIQHLLYRPPPVVFCNLGAAVPAAVCRWGLARAVLMWGGVSRGYTIIITSILRNIWFPPARPCFAIQHAIWVTAISCKGQVGTIACVFGLYKTFVYFSATVNEPVIILLPPPPVMSTLSTAQGTPPPRPSFCIIYTIQYWQWRYCVKAKCVCVSLDRPSSSPTRGCVDRI